MRLSLKTSSFSSRLRRCSTNLDKRLLLEFLLEPLVPPWRVWLLVPPLPQASISVFQMIPGETPLLTLPASTSFSMHSPSAEEEGFLWRDPLRLLRRLCLTSAPLSSAEPESFPPLLSFSSSLSSEPWLLLPRAFFRLLDGADLRFRCDLVVNPPAKSLPAVRLLTSASDCRWIIWAMDAWICQTQKGEWNYQSKFSSQSLFTHETGDRYYILKLSTSLIDRISANTT